MNKSQLYQKIAKCLYDNECLDSGNFYTEDDLFKETVRTIEAVLEDYVLIKGEVLE